MSVVTNLVLCLSCSEDESIIDHVNKYEGFREQAGLVYMDDPNLPRGWYGGTKMLEALLYVGAFNHMGSVEQFIDLLRTIKWRRPEFVQLLVKEENDDRFRLIDIMPRP